MPETTSAPLREKIANVVNRLRLRRRNPWNWIIQSASAALLPLGLLTHSAALAGLAVLGCAAGCLELPLPPMERTGLAWLVPRLEHAIGVESAWLSKPMDRARRVRLALGLAALLFSCWLLWVQDLGPIGLGLAAAYLLHVRRQNKADGIDP